MRRWTAVAAWVLMLVVFVGGNDVETATDPLAAAYGYVMMGRWREAARQFELAARAASDPERRLMAGLAAEVVGDGDAAVDHLQSSASASDGFPELWGLVGDLYLAWGDVERAEEAFRKALAHDDRLALPHRGLARIAEARGDDLTARDHYRAALQGSRALPDIHLSLGRVLYRLHEWDEALEHLLAARRMLPRDPEVHVLLGEVYAAIGERDRAIHALSRALQLDPSATKAAFLLERLQ